MALVSFLSVSCSDDPGTEISDSFSDNEGSVLDDAEARRGRGGSNGSGIEVSRIDSDILQDWMSLFLELDRYAYGMRPNATARALAYINMGAHETALPGMPDFVSNDRLIDGLRFDHRVNTRNLNYELALNAAYADLFDYFILNLPSAEKSKIAQLEDQIFNELSQNVSNRDIDESLSWGTSVARQIIAYSQTDQAAEEQIISPQPQTYEPPVGEGYWTYSAEPERALFPYWKSIRTFAVSTGQSSTVPPVSYSQNPNSNYYQQMVEVYDVNNAAREEDNEQLWIAEFWSDDVEGLLFSPPGRQISIANQLVQEKNLNLERALHLYIKLGISLNDAAVNTWKDKYDYMVMRPSVYIQELMDPDFQTNLYRLIPWPNPSFPGYPSGHSCFASAAAGVFIDFFGQRADLTDRSHEGRSEFRGTPRHFRTFEEMAEENAYSRIPLGVHMRMDCTEGLRLGYEIAQRVNEYSLKRTRS